MTESLEARVQRLEDLLAIHQLFVDYGEHLDSGDFESYALLFAEDGEVLPRPIRAGQGRFEIRRLLTSQLAGQVGTTFHIVSSPRVTLDGDKARSTVMWSVGVLADDGLARISMIGHHRDELIRTVDGWKIQRRRDRQFARCGP